MKLTLRIFRRLVHINRASGCWEYSGAKDSHGYGRMFIAGREHKAQRIAYELLIGPIPEGARLRHHLVASEKCIGYACCNPAHVRLSLHLTGIAPHKPGTCKMGHPLSASNVVIESRKGIPFKRCRLCRREAWKGWRASQRSENLLIEREIRMYEGVTPDRTQPTAAMQDQPVESRLARSWEFPDRSSPLPFPTRRCKQKSARTSEKEDPTDG